MYQKLFQIGCVFLCSAGAAWGAEARLNVVARDGGSSSVNAFVAGGSNVTISSNGLRGGNSDVNLHASGDTDVNVASEAVGPGSVADTDVDVRTASGGRIRANTTNQVHRGRGVNELNAVATQSGVVQVDQFSTVYRGHSRNAASATAKHGAKAKVVNTVIADQSDVDIDSRGSAVGPWARLNQEVLADVHCGRAEGTAVGSATGISTSESLTVLQNGKVHLQPKTLTRGCQSKATFLGDFQVD